MISIADLGEHIQRLCTYVQKLDTLTQPLQLTPIREREWHGLLHDKLLPQLNDEPYLITAVVGGTNTGKSVIFNHIAGESLSAVTAEAAGTKHPLALIPQNVQLRSSLDEQFNSFRLQEWTDQSEPCTESDVDWLFWRKSDVVPENVLVLDTPDIDSDARVNWTRADKIRRAADVLIAVLTSQKFNDAAIKEFFRRAASEEKTVIVIFNQCELPDDEDIWPKWLTTFCHETGCVPAFVYLTPHDRDAVKRLELPFIAREWPPQPNNSTSSNTVRSLRQDLSDLRFNEIKIRSLKGGLQQVIDDTTGLPSWLREINSKSETAKVILTQLSDEAIVEVQDWPLVSFPLVFDEFWSWWGAHRTGWTQSISSFYEVVNHGIRWPVRTVQSYLRPNDIAEETTIDVYLQRERNAILKIAERVFDRLARLANESSEPACVHLKSQLTGEARREFIAAISQSHSKLNARDDLNRLIANDLREFFDENPRTAVWLRRLDSAAVGSRPALSLLLFAAGAHGVEIAAQGLVNIAVDFLAGSAVTLSADNIVSKAAGSFGAALFARLRAIPRRFAEQRASWFADELKQHVLKTLPDELQHTVKLPAMREYRAVTKSLDELRTIVHRMENVEATPVSAAPTPLEDSPHESA